MEDGKGHFVASSSGLHSTCNKGCPLCCEQKPVLDLLPPLTPELLSGMFGFLKFAEAAAVTVKRPVESVSFVESWNERSEETMEIGIKGSGVWLRTEDISTALSTARNFVKCPDKAYFRKLLTLAVGEDKLRDMAINGQGATNVPSGLFCAVEDEVNREFHRGRPKPARKYYLKAVNNMLGHIRHSIKKTFNAERGALFTEEWEEPPPAKKSK